MPTLVRFYGEITPVITQQGSNLHFPIILSGQVGSIFIPRYGVLNCDLFNVPISSGPIPFSLIDTPPLFVTSESHALIGFVDNSIIHTEYDTQPGPLITNRGIVFGECYHTRTNGELLQLLSLKGDLGLYQACINLIVSELLTVSNIGQSC